MTAIKISLKIIISLIGSITLLMTALLSEFYMPHAFGVSGIWLPFVYGFTVWAVLMLALWRPFKKKTRLITALSFFAAAALLTAVFAGPELYRHSLPRASEDEIDLIAYMPFGYNAENRETKAASLNGVSSLRLYDNLPRLDGATALYPLYAAFVRAVYPEDDYFPYEKFLTEGDPGYGVTVICTRTDGAFQNLISGKADLVFLMGISDAQQTEAEQQGLTLTLTPVGREAFVFFVNSRNRVEGLTSEDIRNIYTGAVTNWREVGGGSHKIRAYQRPANSGSQTMLMQIMDGRPVMEAPREDVYGSMMGLYRRVADYRNYQNSLGYSFLFYINGMINENKVKFLAVDGVAPTPEHIADGTYPFADHFYAVTAKRGGAYLNPERAENTDAFIAWILSPQGQYLVEATGYTANR